jgi:hypothetical protein
MAEEKKDKNDTYIDELIELMDKHKIPKLTIYNGTTTIRVSNDPNERFVSTGMGKPVLKESRDSEGTTEGE